MNAILLAQAGIMGAVGYYVIIGIVIVAIVGIGLVAARASGIAIPPWVINIFWIVLVACVAIIAIKFLLSMT